jgi:Asp/Glu/hydantoin racemase
MRLVGLIHSTRLVIEPIHRVMALQCPDIDFFHLMDEGILRKLTATGQITTEIIQWLAEMVLSAERAGADLAVVSCSSLSPCVPAVQKLVDIPVWRIDAPMMEHAVTHAERIGLVMTNPTTEAPSKILLREISRKLRRAVTLVPRLCPNAFAKLNQGDIRGHDLAVIQTVEELLAEVDVIMLAQISIARIKDSLPGAIQGRVLSSLDFIAPEINQWSARKP